MKNRILSCLIASMLIINLVIPFAYAAEITKIKIVNPAKCKSGQTIAFYLYPESGIKYNKTDHYFAYKVTNKKTNSVVGIPKTSIFEKDRMDLSIGKTILACEMKLPKLSEGNYRVDIHVFNRKDGSFAGIGMTQFEVSGKYSLNASENKFAEQIKKGKKPTLYTVDNVLYDMYSDGKKRYFFEHDDNRLVKTPRTLQKLMVTDTAADYYQRTVNSVPYNLNKANCTYFSKEFKSLYDSTRKANDSATWWGAISDYSNASFDTLMRYTGDVFLEEDEMSRTINGVKLVFDSSVTKQIYATLISPSEGKKFILENAGYAINTGQKSAGNLDSFFNKYKYSRISNYNDAVSFLVNTKTYFTGIKAIALYGSIRYTDNGTEDRFKDKAPLDNMFKYFGEKTMEYVVDTNGTPKQVVVYKQVNNVKYFAEITMEYSNIISEKADKESKFAQLYLDYLSANNAIFETTYKWLNPPLSKSDNIAIVYKNQWK